MAKHTNEKDDLDRWREEQYAKDPGMEHRVQALMTEMEIEMGLTSLREASHVSQAQLAKRLGVSQPAVAKIEAGKVKNIGIRTLAKYVAALGGRLKVEILPWEAEATALLLMLAPGWARAAQLTLTWTGEEALIYAAERESSPGEFVEIGRTLVGVMTLVDTGVSWVGPPRCGNGRLNWNVVKLTIAPILDDRVLVIDRRDPYPCTP